MVIRDRLAGHLGRLTETTQGISAVDLQASVIGWNAEHLRELLEPFNTQFAEMALRSVRVDNAGRLVGDVEELDRGERQDLDRHPRQRQNSNQPGAQTRPKYLDRRGHAAREKP